MGKFSSVSIVIPAINETESLRENVEVILQTCEHKDLKEFFIVICEKTTDECIHVIKSLTALESDIPIRLYHQNRPGLGSALYESMQQVTGSHVVNMAADLDTDAYIIKDMIEASKENPDAIVLASRWIKGGGFEGYGRIYKVLNYIFQKILQILFLTKLTDITYGFRLAPVDKTLSVTWEAKGFSIGMETNLKMLRLGYKIIEIPTVWRVRDQGKSQNSFFKKLKYILTVLKVRFSSIDSIKCDSCKEKVG